MLKIVYLWQNRAHYCREINKIIRRQFWSFYNILSAKWWGVKIGSHSSFLGKTHFERLQNTSITIGDFCIFNSSKTSNLIGLYSPCIFYTAKEYSTIKIGNNCGFSGTRIWAAKRVILGNNVRCGANTYITDSDAHPEDYRAGDDKPVYIDENVWLGTNVVVLKGVHIGANSLIGANSVVTRDIPANVVAVGNPCRVIKQLKK